MKHIKKIASYSMVGSLGLTIVTALSGCGGETSQDAASNAAAPAKQETGMETLESDLKQENFFLVIEQTGENPDKYQLAEKYPTEGETRAVLRKMDGSEVVLSNEELTQLAEAEAQKVEDGTSTLTQEPTAESSGGLSLGETILASAAGALIGGMIANKLAGNQNFQRHQQANSRPSARISSPGQNRAAPSSTQQAKPKSGFFNGNNNAGSSSNSNSSSSPKSFGG